MQRQREIYLDVLADGGRAGADLCNIYWNMLVSPINCISSLLKFVGCHSKLLEDFQSIDY